MCWCLTIFGVNFFRLNFRLIRVYNTFFHFVLLEFDSWKSFQSKCTEYFFFISEASCWIGIRRREQFPRTRNENSTEFFVENWKKGKLLLASSGLFFCMVIHRKFIVFIFSLFFDCRRKPQLKWRNRFSSKGIRFHSEKKGWEKLEEKLKMF